MIRYAFILLLLISGSLAAMYFFLGVPRVYREDFPERLAPHVYDDPSKPISQILVLAFYFVPKNKVDEIYGDWKVVLESNLEQLKRFHVLQFQERSDFHFIIFPEPVIGERDNLFYDTEVTQYGNPRALFSASQEIERRVFNEGGDLFRPDFSVPNRVSTERNSVWNGTYRVMLILYEGVGAIGGVVREDGDFNEAAAAFPGSVIFPVGIRAVDGFLLFNRDFLISPEYSAYGGSILAHEFYHTLGIPDAYEVEHDIPTSDDLLGLGRNKPLEKTYIHRDTLRKMGL